MVLTARDYEILRAVERHRLLRSTHVLAVAGGSRQAALRRLQLLFHHGYLDRPISQLTWYTRGSEPMVYALGSSGARALQVAETQKRSRVRWRTKNGRLSRHFLAHTLAVAEIMVGLEVACRGRRMVEFIGPQEVLAAAPSETRRLRLPFRWQVDVRVDSGPHSLGIEPDRVFGLRFSGEPDRPREAFFFLEADRGTMPVMRRGIARTSFYRKLLAYEATWQQALHKRRFGISSFRVLTVTKSRKRLKSLVAVCQRSAAGGARRYLFAHQADLACYGVAGRIWRNGRGEPDDIFPSA